MESKIVIGDNIDINKMVDCSFSLSFLPEDILNCWESAGNLSDSVAEHYQCKFSSMPKNSSISMILNELIENATKFSKDKSSSIEIDTKKIKDKLLICISNEVTKHDWNQFIKISNELFSSNLHSLFLSRLYKLKNRSSSPGLGLILLKKDYNVELSFSFIKYDSNTLRVAVTAEIPMI